VRFRLILLSRVFPNTIKRTELVRNADDAHARRADPTENYCIGGMCGMVDVK